MIPRNSLPLLLLPLTLGLASARAQEEKPKEPTTQPATTAPKPVEQRIAELEKEKERLIQEIGYVRELLAKGGLAARVAEKLERRYIEPKAVDAGASKPPAPVGLAPRRATLMTDEEKERFLPDVILVVQGRPVRKAGFDELYEHLKSANPDADDDSLRGRVILELIRTEYAHSHFAESAVEAANEIREIEAALGRGVEFEHLARNRSLDPSAEQGGDLGFIVPNSGHPLKLEQLAFTTEVGKVSPVFRTPLGYNLLRVTEEKEADAGRSVRVGLILIPYHAALDEVREVQRNVSLGQVDLAIRDEATRQLLPPMFR